MLTWLKRIFIPRSLMARVQVLLILPIVLIISLSALLFFVRHWYEVQTVLVRSVIREVAFLLDNRHQSENWLTKTAAEFNILVYRTDQTEITEPRYLSNSGTDTLVKEFVALLIGRDFDLNSQRDDKVIDLWVDMPDGVYHFNFHQRRIASFTIRLMIALVLTISVLFSVIAALFMRKQLQPIVALTRLIADHPPWQPGNQFHQLMKTTQLQGAREVRDLTRAFLRLQQRQASVLHERTEMLRGISHDLRSPLTRMSLQVQMLPPSEENDALRADMELMTRMLESYLQFSSERGLEEPEPVQITQIIEELQQRWLLYLGNTSLPGTDDKAMDRSTHSLPAKMQGKALNLLIDQALDLEKSVNFRPNMLIRALDNVIDNGFRFANHVQVSLREHEQYLLIAIADDGTGVPEEHRARILEPFQRLDENRIASGGGSGLGLALVKETLLLHQGNITLEDSPLGGLEVQLLLPLQH